MLVTNLCLATHCMVHVALQCLKLIMTAPAPKRVAAFPPNVIPADPVKNRRVKLTK